MTSCSATRLLPPLYAPVSLAGVMRRLGIPKAVATPLLHPARPEICAATTGVMAAATSVTVSLVEAKTLLRAFETAVQASPSATPRQQASMRTMDFNCLQPLRPHFHQAHRAVSQPTRRTLLSIQRQPSTTPLDLVAAVMIARLHHPLPLPEEVPTPRSARVLPLRTIILLAQHMLLLAAAEEVVTHPQTSMPALAIISDTPCPLAATTINSSSMVNIQPLPIIRTLL